MPAIIRVIHNERPFLMIDVETIHDLSSDLQALGLLVVILSKPDTWRVRPEQLATEVQESKATVYRTINRLIDRGYVVREDFRRRLEHGQFERRTCYTVYEDRRMVPKMPEAPAASAYDTRLDGVEVPF